ncbi:MAG: class I SAM-dependent methyltransferase [Pirellulales bacterium]|nr:class I SAM-dependent methyltransferase [Pirellulales bacterium]
MKSLAHHPKLQKLIGGGPLERLWLSSISRVQIFLLNRHKDPQTVRLVRQVRRQRRSLLTAYEAYTVFSCGKAYAHLAGAMAEVGVYEGGSARLLCEVKGDAELHLFDTFEGLPRGTTHDRSVHRVNQYPCSLESVQGYLKDYPNVHFHQGLFPDSAQDLEKKTYSFVHLDVDLYESTLAGLEYFYPLLIPGGVILSHDYSLLVGVRKAFDEFLRDKRERPVELPSTQCMLIKLPAEG